MRVRRPTATVLAAALAAVAALSLSACGSDAKQPGRIKTADDAERSSPSATPSDPASASGKGKPSRPEVTLPKDLKLTFTPTSTDDAKKDAVLKDDELFLKSADQAFTDYNVTSGPFLSYAAGPAAQWVTENAHNYREAHGGSVPTGSGRYYDRTVHFSSPTSATVKECFYQRDYFDKNKKTGKVYRTKPGPGNYQYYLIHHTKTPQSVWVADKVTGKDKAVDECKP